MNTETASYFYNSMGVPEFNGPFSPRSDMLFDRIRDKCEKIIFQGAKVLDIGCGNGRYAFKFEKLGASPVGIDCAYEIIEYAKNAAKEHESQAEFVCADALDMPFSDNYFDIIFLAGNNIAEFSYDDIEIICKESKRALKKNGYFCVSMNDCRIHDNGKSFDLSTYIPEEGKRICYYGQGEKYEYHAYYWTIAFAKHIFGKYFDKIEISQTDEKRFWIQCS